MIDVVSDSSEPSHEALRGGSGCRHHRPAHPERPPRSLSAGPLMFAVMGGSDRDATPDDEHSSPRATRTRSGLRALSETDSYTTPRLRTKFGERAFSFSGPASWNSLDPCWTISCDNSETVRDRMSVTINY